MAQASADLQPSGPRLGDGEFPAELDRVNFGAFLLAVIWAPIHRLWGWLGVFALLEVLESAIGLGASQFFGGVFERPAAMLAFRIVYWSVTVAFALRANRLVWMEERRRAARTEGVPATRRPSLVSDYVSHQRVWTVVGLVLLVATPLSLLIGSVKSSPAAVVDVVATVASQVVLLAGLFVYDKARVARRQVQR